MHFSTTLTALLAPAAVFGLGQINFYWDTNCQQYAGEAHPDRYVTAGGPAGSRSMLFVSLDQCSNTCNYMKFCKNPECNAWDKADRIGQCKSFTNGVWGQQGCGCI